MIIINNDYQCDKNFKSIINDLFIVVLVRFIEFDLNTKVNILKI